jgi:ATPase subunit of ABC transporter with duplicated ATPase domains
VDWIHRPVDRQDQPPTVRFVAGRSIRPGRRGDARPVADAVGRERAVMPVIEVSNLHKRYRDTVAVHDVSFAVEPGEIFGVLGPNGAGQDHHRGVSRGTRRGRAAGQ